MNKPVIAALAAVVAAGSAQAAFDLRITEIWPGNEPGSNLTDDWFEVTNFGDTAFTFGVDGALAFDDESQDFADSGELMGVVTIGAGESVVFVDGNAVEFGLVWGAGVSGVQIGTYDGSGLGQGGDGVTLFLNGNIIDFQTYPNANATGGQSWDVVLGAFSTVGNASGAFQSTLSNDEGQFAIASPGAIPAPGAAGVLGVAGLLAARRRRG